jgi:hypothetical protein
MKSRTYVLISEQTTRDGHPKPVTLSETKGLKIRGCAALSMTFLGFYIVKSTNVVCFNLAFLIEDFSHDTHT